MITRKKKSALRTIHNHFFEVILFVRGGVCMSVSGNKPGFVNYSNTMVHGIMLMFNEKYVDPI